MMYTSHFGFKEKPFKIKDKPGFFYVNPGYDKAYSTILSAIVKHQGNSLLIAEAGVGKTALLRRLMTSHSENAVRFIYLSKPFWSFIDLLKHLGEVLKLEVVSAEKADHWLQALKVFVLAQAREEKTVALLLDDAHDLPDQVLQELPLISNAADERLLPLVLCGLPSLEEKLKRPHLHSLRESIVVRHRLTPLEDTEIESFISHQLRAVGYEGDDLFPPEVIAPLASYGKGIPRSVAALCDAALFLASLEPSKKVTPEIIEEAAKLSLLSDEFALVSARTPRREPALETVSTDAAQVFEHEQEGKSAVTFADNLDEDRLAGGSPVSQTRERSRLVASEREQEVNQEVNKQTVAVALDRDLEYKPGQLSVLCMLIMNPKGAPFREVRIRFHSPDVPFAGHARPRRIKLLGRRDAFLVYLNYQGPENPIQTILSFEVDVCNQDGEWWAYNSRHDVILDFIGGDNRKVAIDIDREASVKLPLITKPARSRSPGRKVDDLMDLDQTLTEAVPEDPLPTHLRDINLQQLLLMEVVLDPERTRRLQAEVAFRTQLSGQGKTMTRAVLYTQNPDQAPQRIELVSRPFMVFGRYNEIKKIGFADFALGFLPQYLKISRLHCAVCAMGDGLAIMHVGAHASGFTRLNNRKLIRGQWQRIESGDVVDICGLYELRIAMAWDTIPCSPDDLSESVNGEKIGQCLLEVVDLVKRTQPTRSDDAREGLKKGFGNLLYLQEEATRLNGINSLGPLLYARFQREDAGRCRVIHIYLPKRLTIGNSPQAGLYVNAGDVVPKHAELLFKDGMYWIQDLAGRNDVRVRGHRLRLYETLPLENGDTIDIGTAHFVFEGY